MAVFRYMDSATDEYTCQLSRLRGECHACWLKTSMSRRLTLAGLFLTPDWKLYVVAVLLDTISKNMLLQTHVRNENHAPVSQKKMAVIRICLLHTCSNVYDVLFTKSKECGEVTYHNQRRPLHHRSQTTRHQNYHQTRKGNAHFFQPYWRENKMCATRFIVCREEFNQSGC